MEDTMTGEVASKPKRYAGPERPHNNVELGAVLRDKDRRYRGVNRTLTAIELDMRGAADRDRYLCRVKVNGVDQHNNQYIKAARLQDPSRYEVIERPAAVDNAE